MSNPYSSAEYPRPSYANVAAGSTSDQHTSRNSSSRTASAAVNPTSRSPHPQDRAQMARQESRRSQHSISAGDQSASNGTWNGHNAAEIGQHDDSLGYSIYGELPPFFTPSYLRHSRHAQRLRSERDNQMLELEAYARLNPPSKRPALSASSSTTNLHKTQSPLAQRAVVQDVFERRPPANQATEEGKLQPLPSKWNEDDRASGLDILGAGSEVRFTGGLLKTLDDAASIRTEHPIPKDVGLYYFEVTVLSKGKDGLIGIGFSGRKTTLTRLPGWESESWAYHGDDGNAFSGSANGKAYGPRFSAQDVIGCGINFRTSTAFFTKNGVSLGTAFHDVKGDRLYPSVGLKRPNEHLRANFGRHPFVFDIDAMMDRERALVLTEINRQSVTSLHPPDDVDSLVNKLISQYLAHEGYIETSKAFTQDLTERQKAIHGIQSGIPIPGDDSDDVHAIHRQKIRRSILDGDIDRALKYTHSYFPLVLQEERNKDVYFRLRCRKFIEMMRRYSELNGTPLSPALAKSVDSLRSNGHHDPTDSSMQGEDGPDAQMELDDQLQREASDGLEINHNRHEDVDMDASVELPSKSTVKQQNDLLTAAIEYGRELRAEFGSDDRPSVIKHLSDIFAIVAYPDPRSSVVGGLLDKKGRVTIADELNGAILVSLGKPSSAALEKFCAQTEAFLDAVASKTGGAAGFVNVQKDFLQA